MSSSQPKNNGSACTQACALRLGTETCPFVCVAYTAAGAGNPTGEDLRGDPNDDISFNP